MIKTEDLIETDHDNLKCILCNERFECKPDALKHLKLYHKVNVDKFDTLEMKRKAFKPTESEIDFLNFSLLLKRTARTGWMLHNVVDCESVADHSFMCALAAFVLCPQNLDREKVLKISLIHDLAEAIVGDITPYDNIHPDDKHRMERDAFNFLIEGLSENLKIELKALFDEYMSKSTEEAKFVKTIDIMDMKLTAKFYEEEQNLDLSPFWAPKSPKVID